MELIQWHACSLLYCISIIACAKAIQDVQLEDMGCSVGEYNINALELEDKMCIRKSEKRIEILHENKESSRRRSVKEEGKAGKNKLWMRKVQLTKLGPSRQLLVNGAAHAKRYTTSEAAKWRKPRSKS